MTSPYVRTTDELFAWRLAIIHSRALEPSTRLVLFALSMHYPVIEVSQARLAVEASLGRKAVGVHLEKARAGGWVTRVKPHNHQEDDKSPDKYELNKRYYPQKGQASPGPTNR